MQWCQKKLKNLSRCQSQTQEWREVDERMGEYVSIEVLCEKYGYSVSPTRATTAARTYAQKCAELSCILIIEDHLS
eukprot:1227508-Lingulodinium_polyedra.AAC.1